MTNIQRGSAAWLTSQYNNRARVADHQRYLDRWASASAAVRASVPCVTDVPYGGDASEGLDIFSSSVPGPSPVLFFIHGGWWRSLDKSDHSFIAPAFTRAGATVVVPNYALCPSVGIDHIALQMTKALAWVWRHVARHGGDPGRIVVAGHSAGGHLAAMMLTCRWPEVDTALPASLVRSALAISGVFDLEPLRRTPFLQADLRLTRASVARLSPARMPAPRVPLFAVDGVDESEEFARQRRLIRQAWGSSAVPICEGIPGTNHFSVLDELVTVDSHLHQLAMSLLAQPAI